MKRSPIKRKKAIKQKQAGLRRKRLRQVGKKQTNRAKHKGERDEYLRANPRCEFRCGRAAVEVDHVVQKAGSTFEVTANYFAVCRCCHDSKHRENRRGEQIGIKRLKGEWLTDAEQIEVFGRTYG